MPMKPFDLPIDDLVTAYLAGDSARNLAIQHGIKPGTLTKRFRQLGILRPHRREVPIAQLIMEYESGISLYELGKRYGVSVPVITRRLHEHGIRRRTQSEQEQEKWRRFSPEQRKQQTAAAHAASRGRKISLDTLIYKAQTLQQQGRMQPLEKQVYEWLQERRIPTIPQQAIGPYNCDLGAAPVAVEIFGGNWHWHGQHAARLLKRLDYIL